MLTERKARLVIDRKPIQFGLVCLFALGVTAFNFIREIGLTRLLAQGLPIQHTEKNAGTVEYKVA